MLKKMLSLFTLGMFVIYLGLLIYGCASTGGRDYSRSDDFVIPDMGIPSDLP